MVKHKYSISDGSWIDAIKQCTSEPFTTLIIQKAEQIETFKHEQKSKEKLCELLGLTTDKEAEMTVGPKPDKMSYSTLYDYIKLIQDTMVKDLMLDETATLYEIMNLINEHRFKINASIHMESLTQ